MNPTLARELMVIIDVRTALIQPLSVVTSNVTVLIPEAV